MILSKRAYGVIISKNKTRKVFLFQQCCIAYFSDDFHAKLIFMCLKVSLRKISLCMKFYFCIYRAPKQEKKMSFEKSKMENLFIMFKFSQLILKKCIETCNENPYIDFKVKRSLRREILPNSPIRNVWRQVKRIC